MTPEDVAVVRDAVVGKLDAWLAAFEADFNRRLLRCGAPSSEFIAIAADLFVARCEALVLLERLLADLSAVH